MSRYEIGIPSDSEFQPGSNGSVLRNLRGIVDPSQIDRIEASLLVLAQGRSFGRIESSTLMTVRLIRELHRSWLHTLYSFAGELRTLNLSKEAVHFAPVAHLDSTLATFDAILQVETPCQGMELDQLVRAIARVHIELVLIHPFREGNGRLARWVADLMALQAGAPPLDWQFENDTERRREHYFAALRRGFAGDNAPMESLIREALEQAVHLAEDLSNQS